MLVFASFFVILPLHSRQLISRGLAHPATREDTSARTRCTGRYTVDLSEKNSTE